MKSVIDETRRVAKAAHAAAITSVSRAAAYIRGIAQKSIAKKAAPSKPGSPPHSGTGALRQSIVFAVDRQASTAVIGPTASGIGGIGHTHEFGGVEPAKFRKRRRNRMNIAVGGRGPLRVDRLAPYAVSIGPNKVIVGALRTQAQVTRAQRLVRELGVPDEFTSALLKPKRQYPARPFMGPALRRSRERIPDFWANVIKE